MSRRDRPGVAPAAPLVGRGRELAVLRRAVTRVAGGSPGAVLVTGPLGIGKTRLGHETLAISADTGFRTVRGRASETTPMTAYAPVVGALGPILRGLADTGRRDLLDDLPQLSLLFSGLPVPAPAPLGDAVLERTRLEDGLTRLVGRLAHERPLAMLLDDFHAADDGTVSLVHGLVESLSDEPVLLVLTALTDAPAQDLVGSLHHDLVASAWWVHELELPPLDDTDAVALVDGVTGGALAPGMDRSVVERCAGRPLFLESLATALAEAPERTNETPADPPTGDGMRLPTGLRSHLRARLSGVSADEGAVLRLLAVAGGALDHDVLVHAVDLPTDRALDALDRLARRRMVVDGPDGSGCDLAHGLLRDVLVADMPSSTVARLHTVLVAALESLRPGDASLPEHVLRALPLLDPDRALRLLARGADRARRVGAASDAARFLSGAVTVARNHARTEVVADSLTELGELANGRGDAGDAHARWAEALATYAQLGDPVGIARIERELGMLHWADGDLSAAGARFAAAERALEGLEQSPEHAELLYAKVINGVRTGDSVLVADLAGQLRRLADDLGSSSLSARAYLAEAAHDFGRTDYTAMAEANVRALAAAEASGDARLVIRANDQLSVTAGAQGDLDALRRYSDASVQAAQRIGARILQGWPMMRIGVADLLAGHWDAALRTTSEVMAMATRFHQTRGSVSAGAIHAWVLTHRGRLAEARGHLDRAHRIAHPSLQADRNVFNIVALADVTLALAEGEPERARHDTARLADLTGGWLPLLAAGMLAEAYVCSGDLDGARRLAAHVRAVRSCSTVLPQAVSDWVDGLACAAGDHPPDAVGPLQASASAYASLGFPFHTARARLASAEATADPRLGVELAGDALRVFETLGAPVQAQQARRLLRGLGAAPSRGRARTDTGSVLSARELEVAQLVAAGLTNAEVATRLFISPRTVTTHLDRIYSRVGLSSRVALTRYLADSGLLDAVDEPAGPDGSAAQNT